METKRASSGGFCGAKTRQGGVCRNSPMQNGRCRMHGGKSPGAPKGNKNAWKHGKYSAWAKEIRKLASSING
ncbi:MAG: HGGxSTG domain-containing protein [Hyphomonas sp.]